MLAISLLPLSKDMGNLLKATMLLLVLHVISEAQIFRITVKSAYV
jgi:hypothetical protein